MTEKKVKGDFGEKFTEKYLSDHGFKITERNFRKPCGEIDIIAENDEFLLFVEVKTRKAGSLVSGIDAVGYNKKKRMIATADWYLAERYEGREPDLQPRYDIAEVTFRTDTNKNICVNGFQYLENAFDTTGFETQF